MKIELQRLVDGVWYIYGKYDMSKTHDATAFGEAVSELAKHFNIRTVVSYTDNESTEAQQECFGIYTDNKETLYNYIKRVEELEEQREEMKCPQNCSHGSIFVDRFFDDIGVGCEIERTLCDVNWRVFCEYCNSWEMKKDD